MTFAPLLPSGGTVGWAFLKRTAATQQAALSRSPELQRDAQYFRENIGRIDTADKLVADRRLLRVSLEAFGLEADIDSRAFLRKVLAEGTLKEGAFAMRLADPRYKALTEAFGFGDFTVPNTKLSDFADRILARWQERRFESSVGQQNGDLRLALNARREIGNLASGTASETTKWLRLIGNPPLRQVMQRAFGLPSSFGAIDIDRQVAVLKDKATSAFGSATVSQFSDPAKTEALIRRFLVSSEIDATRQQNPALNLIVQARAFSRRL